MNGAYAPIQIYQIRRVTLPRKERTLLGRGRWAFPRLETSGLLTDPRVAALQLDSTLGCWKVGVQLSKTSATCTSAWLLRVSF